MSGSARSDLLGPRIVAWIARAVARLFYRITRIGSPVPVGPVLLLANHPNALLDPALVWATAGRTIRFLAKSTLFSRHPLAIIVRNSGAIPVYRRQDEGADMSKNLEMFAAVEAALARGEAVCLFPEGKSHSTGRLEELRTGAARIALSSAAEGVRVGLVPIGLNLERKNVFRSHATVTYGDPFQCEDLVARFESDQPGAVSELTDRIAGRLRALIVEAEPQADSPLVDRVERLYSAAHALPADPAARLARRRTIADGLVRLRNKDRALYQKISGQIRIYDGLLARFGIRDRDVESREPLAAVLRFSVREVLLACLLIPLSLMGLILFAVPYAITDVICRARRVPLDVAGTIKAVVGGFVFIAWTIGFVAAAWYYTGVMSGIGLALTLPAIGFASLMAIEHEGAVIETSRCFLAARLAPAKAHRRLRLRQREVADALDRVYEWMRLTGALTL